MANDEIYRKVMGFYRNALEDIEKFVSEFDQKKYTEIMKYLEFLNQIDKNPKYRRMAGYTDDKKSKLKKISKSYNKKLHSHYKFKLKDDDISRKEFEELGAKFGECRNIEMYSLKSDYKSGDILKGFNNMSNIEMEVLANLFSNSEAVSVGGKVTQRDVNIANEYFSKYIKLGLVSAQTNVCTEKKPHTAYVYNEPKNIKRLKDIAAKIKIKEDKEPVLTEELKEGVIKGSVGFDSKTDISKPKEEYAR